MGFFRAFADRHNIGSKVSMKHVSAGGAMIREVGEGAVVGMALGAVHAMAPTGLDIDGKIPLDALVAGIGILGGIGMAHEDFGQDLRNVGASAATIFSFRKAYAFAAARKMADTSKTEFQRIPGDRVQEMNVQQQALMKKNEKNAALLAAAGPPVGVHGEFGFGADAGAEDPILTASRAL